MPALSANIVPHGRSGIRIPAHAGTRCNACLLGRLRTDLVAPRVVCRETRLVVSCRAVPIGITPPSAGSEYVEAAAAPNSASSSIPIQKWWRCARVAALCAVGFAAWAACSACFGPVSANAPFASMSMSFAETSTGSALAMKSAFAGTAAGFLHTLCGPDHLAALTPLTIGRNRAKATVLGALWGFGHSTGQLILGLIFVLLKDRFHEFLPFLDKWAGTVVGLTLIAIGLLGLYETLMEGHHAEHEEEATVKLAYAGGEGAVAQPKSSGKMGLATYATGIVYGLQPDALFVVIPALALPTKLAAAAYCSCFVVGTVAAMAGYTFLIGTTSQALIKDRPWLASHLSTAASGVAILVGSLILAASFGVALPFL